MEEPFITITATGISEGGIKDAEACINRRKTYNSGVWLKAKGPSAERATYSIRVFLSSRRTDYMGLGFHLPRFIHAFDDLSFVKFGFIGIESEDIQVSSASLSAEWITVHTTNGSIDGHFSATRMLDISGSSESITVTGNLCNNGEEHPTAAKILSSQGLIDARIVLCEPRAGPWRRRRDDRPEDNGRYEVFVNNSDAPISLKVKHTIPEQGSSLWIDVSNSDELYTGKSHTKVTLDSGFEGKFSLRSQGDSALPVSVKSEEATDDRGGVRFVEVKDVQDDGRLMSGKVFWNTPASPLDRRRSDVWISTVGEGEVSLLLLGD